MPSKHAPRKGSMQFYPRKRSSHKHPRIRSWAPHAEPKLLGFAGYKVGMTHALIADKRQFSQTKGASIAVPCTVLECPPLKAFSLRFYKTTDKGYLPIADMLGSSLDKSLERSMPLPKSPKKALDQIPEFDDVVVLVHTSPGKTGIGKKMPEIFEISVGGTKEQKLAYAKSILDKEINVSDIFKAGMLVDAHAITKGKGLQGPVKRHGITLKQAHRKQRPIYWRVFPALSFQFYFPGTPKQKAAGGAAQH
ncbi:50S ribosomal protein L3 [Candidatus Woesearchaeota archaeon]|nr:50S ribosomal protein L3 [Candidatus Woesearchaeota archaeon]